MKKEMSIKVNKNVIPDNEGQLYYRDFKNGVEARFFGDYIFKGSGRKKIKKEIKNWGINITKKDTVLFIASTAIFPFYKTAVIKTGRNPAELLTKVKKGLNKKGSQFLFGDTINAHSNRLAFLLWGNYNRSFPDSGILKESEKDKFIIIEAEQILNSITSPQKTFLNDISSLAYEALTRQDGNINYLAPVLSLSNFEHKNLNPSERNYLFQLLSTYQSFLGNRDSALYYYSKAFNKKSRQLHTPDSNLVSAKEKVLQLARENKILLINEAHTDIRNRQFMHFILDDLYALGYRTLAVEALSDKDSLINIRKYAVAETGFYTKEPVFASLLRKASLLGFALTAYDCFPDCSTCPQTESYCCMNRREECEADNISKIIKDNPDSKIIVYGGHDHIYKLTPFRGFKPLAMQLAERGYRFASIDQVKGNYYYLTEDEKEYMSVINNSTLPDDFQGYKADAYIIPPYKNYQAELLKQYKIDLGKLLPKKKYKSRLYIKLY